MRYGSAAALPATVLWQQTPVRYASVSVRSPKPGSTMAATGFTSCSGGRAGGLAGWRAGGIIINVFTDSTASMGCPCVSNAHAGIKPAQRRQLQPQGMYKNHVWGMDFVSDALFDGRRLRLLTAIDLYTRECPGICAGQNLRSTEVTDILNTIALRRPLPQ